DVCSSDVEAYQKFVEDAARLLYEQLSKQEDITDFVIRCAHIESLHSHDAVSRICKGVPNGLRYPAFCKRQISPIDYSNNKSLMLSRALRLDIKRAQLL